MEVKRDKVSLCNICRKKKKLTWDHVPPKGSIELTAVEQRTVFNSLTATEGEVLYTISQNGVKFRTICGKCNNNWLGTKYDPVLNEFSHDVGQLLKTEIHLPDIIIIKQNQFL